MDRWFRTGLRAVLVAAALATAGTAQAAGIEARQENQQDRIGAGIADGSLTQREAHRLERREAHTEAMEQRMRASGNGLSPRERVRLQHSLDRDSRAIHRQRHDAQQR